MDLNKKLSMLVDNSHDDELMGISRDNVEVEEVIGEISPISIDSYLGGKATSHKSSKKSVRKTSILEDMGNEKTPKRSKKDMTTAERLEMNTTELRNNNGYEAMFNFDEFLSDSERFGTYENNELTNNLISMGRKYARDNSSTAESAELSKTFAESERRLSDLFNEIDRDKKNLQQDIDRARLPQRGSSKILSELVSTKNSMHSTQLSIISKDIDLRKAKIELRNKELARKENTEGSTDISSNTLQSIFSSARGQMMEGLGGYSGVSGVVNDDNGHEIQSIYNNDDAIRDKYFNSEEDSEGDIYLKYESRGVEMIAIMVDDAIVDIIAEDRDGNLIQDYPIPDMAELEFNVDISTMRATDNMHRAYKIRQD